MKILIVGAGIGGLALSAFLKKMGHNPKLVDHAPCFSEVGYSLSIAPNGVKVLRELGLEPQIARQGVVLENYLVKTAEGTDLRSINFSEISKKYGNFYGIHRAKLHKILLEANEMVDLELGTTIENLEQTKDKVFVDFSNGMREEFDLVVGADGVDSVVRDFVVPALKPKYFGWTGWAFWIPPFFDFPENVVEMWGKDRIFGVYPHSQKEDKLMGYFAMKSPALSEDPLETRVKRLKENFGGMGWIVDDVLQRLPKDPKCIFHDDIKSLLSPVWYRGRVVLLGDSVHSLTPLSGMGASMAIEDAYVLAHELEKLEAIGYKKVLENYYKIRYPRVLKVKKATDIMAFFLKNGKWLYHPRNFCVKHLPETVFLGDLVEIAGKSVVK